MSNCRRNLDNLFGSKIFRTDTVGVLFSMEPCGANGANRHHTCAHFDPPGEFILDSRDSVVKNNVPTVNQ